MKPSFPWMPKYVDEVLALAAQLTTTQLGAKLRLEAFSWRQDPPCTVPDDDDRLAVISGLGADWSANATALRELYTPVEGGRLLDHGLRARYDEQLEKHRKRSAAGKLGGRPSKTTEKQTESIASGLRNSVSTLGSSRTTTTESREGSKQTESIAFTADKAWREIRETVAACGDLRGLDGQRLLSLFDRDHRAKAAFGAIGGTPKIKDALNAPSSDKLFYVQRDFVKAYEEVAA